MSGSWTNDGGNSITIPSGATTGPRIVIGQAIPAVLAAFNADFTFTNVILYYYNNTDFQFQASAKYNNPTPNIWGVYLEGSYDTTNGVKIDRYEQSPAGTGPLRILLGNETYNSQRLTYETQKLDWLFGPQTQVSMPNGAELGWQYQMGGASAAGSAVSGAVSAGAEVAIPAVSWAPEPDGSLTGGRIYKLEWRANFFVSGATIAQALGTVRVRKGSATIVGDVLGTWYVDALTNFAAVVRSGHTYAVPNSTYTGKLSLSIDHTAGTGSNLNMVGDANAKIMLTVSDCGLYDDAPASLQNMCTFFN